MVDGVSVIDNLISYFSSFHRLKKATAWLLKFREYLQRRIRKVDLTLLKPPLTVKDPKSSLRTTRAF